MKKSPLKYIKSWEQKALCVCARVYLLSVYMCVFAQSLHVLAKPWGGIIANFSPRTQSLPPSLPPFADLHLSLASAAGHVVMRWELTFIIPGGGNTATNRDLPCRLLMMSVQRSHVWVHPVRPALVYAEMYWSVKLRDYFLKVLASFAGWMKLETDGAQP